MNDRDSTTLAQAINAAWRRIKRSRAPNIRLTPFVDGAMAQSRQSDEATADYIRHELARRIARYRPRRPARPVPSAGEA
jgi:hypothetical protein